MGIGTLINTAAVMHAETVSETATTVAQTATDTAAVVHPSIIFPHLGVVIDFLTSGFYIFGIYIAWYGVIIAIGMIVGTIIAYNLARRTGQRGDDYIDMAIAAIIAAIVGARLYYVVFQWDEYKDNLGEIFNLRHGGLAVYGGLIFGILCVLVVCKIKKINFLQVVDTMAPGVVLAQAIGRWGNFMNREAYGGFTDGLFAMQIKYTEANGVVTNELVKNMVNIDGIKYIQVHPTFLYESMWCLAVFILLMIFRKKGRYYGEVVLWYIGGYALGRVWIEGLRTDQLQIGNTGIAISQLLAFVLFFASLAVLIVMRVYIHKDKEKYPYVNLTVPGWKDLKFESRSKEKKAAKEKAAKEGAEENKEHEVKDEGEAAVNAGAEESKEPEAKNENEDLAGISGTAGNKEPETKGEDLVNACAAENKEPEVKGENTGAAENKEPEVKGENTGAAENKESETKCEN